MITQLTPEQLEFFKKFSKILILEDMEETWYYMPYWFRITPEGEVEVFSLDGIPDYLRNEIEQLRK
jgi:hypothetical protein